MIVLDTSGILRARLSAAAATTNPTFLFSYGDEPTSAGPATGAASGALDGTTNATLVDSPEDGLSRVIKSGFIYNGDSDAVTVIVEHYDGTTARQLLEANIPEGATLTFGDAGFAITGGGTLINPMTSAGDIIYGATSGTPIRLGKGADGQVLSLASGLPTWASVAGTGDMLAATYDPAGIAEQVVGETAAQTLTNKDLSDASNTFPADLAKKDAANAFTQQQAVTPYRANISGAVSIDLAATAKSNTLILTLTGNVTSFALTNPVDGANYEIWFLQDATGGHTMPSLPSSMKFSGGTAPGWTTTANARDILCLSYGATEGIYMAAFSPNMG